LFSKYVEEAPKIIFNTNSFKNVKFAASEEEIKKDEDLIKEISKYLKEEAIEKFLKNI
jgi:hypothetical protein